MINPRPVHHRRSPYSSAHATPAATFGLRQAPQPVADLKPPKKRVSWRKVIGLTVLSLIIAASTYAYAQYRNLRDNIIVASEGQSSAILGYDPSNKNSKLDPNQFMKIGDGRFNLVLVGVGGEAHRGSYLTDSIQVLSVDTINKKITTTSLPRDLYVTIPGYGRAKINSAYEIGERRKANGGPALVKEVVGNVLGVKISNFGLVDFTGVKSLVDALGGIDINVPKAINDPYFPDEKLVGYAPFSVKAGPQKMNGETALKYSRSRKTTSDFDRSERQQLVIEAIKKKALSLGVLSNPVKINNFVTSLGKHTKTDMQIDQIKSFLSIYKDIPGDQSKTFVLDTSSELSLLTSTVDPTAGYIAFPPAGFDKFEDIQRWFMKNSPDPLLARETPTVTVVNGGKATDKQMQTLVALLKDYGYNATLGAQPVAKGKYSKTQIYQSKAANSKIFSKNYLGSQFNVAPETGSPLGSGSDFEIIYFPSTTSASTIKK